MRFKGIEQSDIEFFIQQLGEQYVFSDKEVLERYGSDETEDLNHPPEVLLKPRTPAEVSSILRHCNDENIPVTTIGARTGLSGLPAG